MPRGQHHRYSHQMIHDLLVQRWYKGDNDPDDGTLRQALFCPYYVPLEGVLGMDWGLIVNPKSQKFGSVVFEHDECFSGDTRFITAHGIRTLRECAGYSVPVLGHGGAWRMAEIRHFGQRQLWRVELSRYEDTKVVLTTEGHRWFVQYGKQSTRYPKPVLTKNLKIGTTLASMFGRVSAHARPSAFGIAHGIVFGDGTHPLEGWRNPAFVVLYGDKNRNLKKWFPLSPTTEAIYDGGSGLRVNDLPRGWKQPPDMEESQSYLYGWLAGYFAADGSVHSSGNITLASANRRHLEIAQDIAARLGIGTLKIKERLRVGRSGKRIADIATTIYTLPFMAATLREDFFLVDEHRRRFTDAKPSRVNHWRVANVSETDKTDDVYCAVEPVGHVFTLEGNLLTGNCGCHWNGNADPHPGDWQAEMDSWLDKPKRRKR